METSNSKLQLKELKLPVPWGHIAAKAWGSPSDKHVLLVHGILDNAGSYDRLIALLPQFFYYVCIDLPGHGLSSQFPKGVPLDYFAYVLSLRFVLDALKWERCIYIGHSFGAMLGICLTSLYPARIEKVITIDGAIPPEVPNEKLITRLREIHEATMKYSQDQALQVYSKDEVLHALMFRRGSTLNSEAAKCLFERAVTKVGTNYKYNRDPRVRIGLKPLMNYSQHMEILSKIRIPILIIVANANTKLDSLGDMKETVEAIRDSKVIHDNLQIVMVEGNHDVHNNHPERVAPYIADNLVSSTKSKL